MATVTYEKGILIFAPLFGASKTQLVSAEKASSLAKTWDKLARSYGQQGYSAPYSKITTAFSPDNVQVITAHGHHSERAAQWLKSQSPRWMRARGLEGAEIFAQAQQ